MDPNLVLPLELDAASKKPIVFLGNLIFETPCIFKPIDVLSLLTVTVFSGVRKFLFFSEKVATVGSMSSDSVSLGYGLMQNTDGIKIRYAHVN